MSFLYYWSKILKIIRGSAVIDSKISAEVKIASGCQIVNSSIDRYSDIGYDCRINNTEIGKFCSFGAGIVIGGNTHTVHWISTSTAFNVTQDPRRKKLADHHFNASCHTVIGNDVWIGDGAFIKAGVVIGTGAVIGMGAVVTHDVPPYEIWAGNPARKVRSRFSEDIVRQILDSEWWNMDEPLLQKYAQDFPNPEVFLEKLKQNNQKMLLKGNEK